MRFILGYCFILLFFLSCKEQLKDASDFPIGAKQDSFKIQTLQMMDSLNKIKANTQFRNHRYESSAKLKLVEQEVNQAKANKTLNAQLYIEYGKVLLNAGRSRDAIYVFEDILTKMPENKVINATTKGLHEALAICYMRLGEQTNCRDNHSAESCLFPIKGSGIHTNREGSQKGIAIYKEILKVFPEDLQSRWLINLAYMTLGEYPDKVPETYLIPSSVFEPEYDIEVFENISMNVGLDINELAGGVILDDFNNDGFIDIIVSSWGLFGQIHYFVSDGNGKFNEQTENSGLKGLTGGLNLSQADYNNDGYLDFYVMRGAWSGYKWMGQLPNSLLRNNGDGTFTDVSISSGIYARHPTQSSVWLDFNNDGWLDLFVGNETHSEKELNPAQFFLNQKDGTFINIAPQLGLDVIGYIKGVTAGDINNDGLTDIYVSIIDGPNKLFVNRGGSSSENWNFEERSEFAKVTEPLESFPTWFFDYNNDGWEDIFVTCFDTYSLWQQSTEVAADYLGKKYSSDLPRLYKNNKKEGFVDATKSANLDRILPTMGCNYGDLDNDGYLDFYLGTGAPDFRAIVPNRMFRNNAGKSFQDVTYSGNFGHVQKGHGIGFADLDNDGDQDIYAVMGGSVSGDIFQNALFENPGNDNNWITIRLRGTSSNRSAIGARIKVTIENEDESKQDIYNTLSSGGSFGANSLQAEIGLGNCKKIVNVAINWPNGLATYIDYGAPSMGTVIRIEEGQSNFTEIKQKSFSFSREHHSMSH
jgi:hypothetical protein